MNIIVVIIILAILGGGGFYLFKLEQAKSRKEKRIADIEEKVKDTTKFRMYSECDYLGDELEISSEIKGQIMTDGVVGLATPIKSMIIPKGFTVDTYTKPNKGGIKISYKGPTTFKCLSSPIYHIEWKKS